MSNPDCRRGGHSDFNSNSRNPYLPHHDINTNFDNNDDRNVLSGASFGNQFPSSDSSRTTPSGSTRFTWTSPTESSSSSNFDIFGNDDINSNRIDGAQAFVDKAGSSAGIIIKAEGFMSLFVLFVTFVFNNNPFILELR